MPETKSVRKNGGADELREESQDHASGSPNDDIYGHEQADQPDGRRGDPSDGRGERHPGKAEWKPSHWALLVVSPRNRGGQIYAEEVEKREKRLGR